jgi:hypothetical protein
MNKENIKNRSSGIELAKKPVNKSKAGETFFQNNLIILFCQTIDLRQGGTEAMNTVGPSTIDKRLKVRQDQMLQSPSTT